MNDEIRKYLADIRDCILFIEHHLGGQKQFKLYVNNSLLKAAVERKLEIIGEALNKCTKHYPDMPITNKERIIGTRNRIIHAYDAVDDIMIWEIIVKHLPLLKAEVELLLNSDKS